MVGNKPDALITNFPEFNFFSLKYVFCRSKLTILYYATHIPRIIFCCQTF